MPKIALNIGEILKSPPIKIGENIELIGYYKLLRFLSGQYKGKTILEGGTYNGHSAYALAINGNNNVITCDVHLHDISCISYMMNVQMLNCSMLDIEDRIIRSSPFIFVDLDHTGGDEQKFYDRLVSLHYKGFTLWDDIYSFSNTWDGFQGRKWSFDQIHNTGFGILDMGDNLCITET